MNVVVVGSKESMKLFEEYNEELLRPTGLPASQACLKNQFAYCTVINTLPRFLTARQYSGMYCISMRFIYLMLSWHDWVIRALVIDNGTHHVINLSTYAYSQKAQK